MIKIKPTVTRVTKAPVTKVTKTTLAALRNAIAKGRPRKHGTDAQRQKAYRARKRQANG